ncbi:MAG: hypothetical protein WCP45_16475 [Verrucomicrobiota bacterium]
MSEINLTCPVCNSPVSADESETGTMITCLNCSSELLVPDGEGPVAFTAHVRPDEIPITSGSILAPHKILGMVCYSLGTRGGMKNDFENKKQTYSHRLASSRQKGQLSKGSGVGQFIGGASIDGDGDVGLSGQFAGASFRSDDIEIAFSIAVGELKLRASYLGGNALIGFRWDVDFDSHANVVNFFGTAYATAIQLL